MPLATAISEDADERDDMTYTDSTEVSDKADDQFNSLLNLPATNIQKYVLIPIQTKLFPGKKC